MYADPSQLNRNVTIYYYFGCDFQQLKVYQTVPSVGLLRRIDIFSTGISDETAMNTPERSRSVGNYDDNSIIKSKWRSIIPKTKFRKIPENIGPDGYVVTDDDDDVHLKPHEYSVLKGQYGTYFLNKYHHHDENNLDGLGVDNGVDALTDFEPRPLRSLFSSKQPHLRILVINDKKYLRYKMTNDSKHAHNFIVPSASEIKSLSMNDLLDDIVLYVSSQLATTKTPSRINAIPSPAPVSKLLSQLTMSKSEDHNKTTNPTELPSPLSRIGNIHSYISNHAEQFEKVQDLRGRDLCCVVRHINEVDIPVVMFRQHACIFSIRYDVKAIVQAHRIIFIGENADDDFRGLKRHMNGK